MKITAIVRKVTPELAQIVSPGIAIGEVILSAPAAVSDINFYETGASGSKAYRGPCYVLSFANSNTRHVVPAAEVALVIYETEEANKTSPKKKKPITAAALPNMDDDLLESNVEESV